MVQELHYSHVEAITTSRKYIVQMCAN